MDMIREVFYYLDELRDSGATNMFGATDYLIRDFDLGSEEARELLSHWMRTFSDDLSVEERVKLI